MTTWQGRRSHFKRGILWIVLLVLILFGLLSSQVLPKSQLEAIRGFADGIRFNYTRWTLDALFNKAVSASLKAEKFLNDEQQTVFVEKYFEQVSELEAKENALLDAFNAPGADNEQAIDDAKIELETANSRLKALTLLSEAIIQNQTERTLLALGFGTGGQIIPPVLYQVTDLPLNLIVSPREEIATALSISLEPGLNAQEKNEIEARIFSTYDHAALIEAVGGVGAYPTMVMRSNNLNWLAETVAHEWIHNYLSLRPLGARYFRDNTMRTINETTASLSGKEIGRALIAYFYPKRIVSGFAPLPEVVRVPNLSDLNLKAFNFRAEMRETRVSVDELLANGLVDEAEVYMENRRHLFWEAGYRIRKLNQAYFAFYGSYNDTPGGGASGKDPIGPAVRALRYSMPGLKPFIDAIQNVRHFEDLMKLQP